MAYQRIVRDQNSIIEQLQRAQNEDLTIIKDLQGDNEQLRKKVKTLQLKLLETHQPKAKRKAETAAKQKPTMEETKGPELAMQTAPSCGSDEKSVFMETPTVIRKASLPVSAGKAKKLSSLGVEKRL